MERGDLVDGHLRRSRELPKSKARLEKSGRVYFSTLRTAGTPVTNDPPTLADMELMRAKVNEMLLGCGGRSQISIEAAGPSRGRAVRR